MANLMIIKAIAEREGISIRELADKVGVGENRIHVMCKTNSTKIETLEKISKILGVSPAIFFENNATPPDYAATETQSGHHNQQNAQGACGNINGDASAIMNERVKHLEALCKEKDARIADLKERITELKAPRH